jgi:hypothetical protein
MENMKVERIMEADACDFTEWASWFGLAAEECATIGVYDCRGSKIPRIQKLNLDTGEVTFHVKCGNSILCDVVNGVIVPIAINMKLTVFELRSARGWSKFFDMRDAGSPKASSPKHGDTVLVKNIGARFDGAYVVDGHK